MLQPRGAAAIPWISAAQLIPTETAQKQATLIKAIELKVKAFVLSFTSRPAVCFCWTGWLDWNHR